MAFGVEQVLETIEGVMVKEIGSCVHWTEYSVSNVCKS